MKAKLYTHNGITMTIRQWAESVGIRPGTMKKRLDCGFAFDEAISPSSLRPARTGKTYKQTGIGHQRSKRDHVLIVEKALGKEIPAGSVVHHIDGNINNNANDNLLLCPSDAYHFLIHARQRAYEECGNANYQKCVFCKSYDDPGNMKQRKAGRRGMHHRECYNAYMRNIRAHRIETLSLPRWAL